MLAGEVVIAFEYSNGRYYCFDPNGRMVVFQGKNCISPAPPSPNAGVGLMQETIPLLDGNELPKGAFYWITSQNTATSTVKITVANGKTFEIPQSKIRLYTASIKSYIDSQIFRTVKTNPR